MLLQSARDHIIKICKDIKNHLETGDMESLDSARIKNWNILPATKKSEVKIVDPIEVPVEIQKYLKLREIFTTGVFDNHQSDVCFRYSIYHDSISHL